MNLNCQYLVVGAGAASLAFIDTLLTELPSAKVILVDKNPAPGGHWIHDYTFVRLHQPSVVYGLASRQLEGNWLKCLLWKRTLPWNHRASKQEILRYFKTFVDNKVASGHLEYFPNCSYDFSQKDRTKTHHFSSLDGKHKYKVKVSEKLVNGIQGECRIPSQHPPKFDFDEDINMVTPNEIYEMKDTKGKEYTILGCGKTAMDTIVYLQRTLNVKPEAISWVIPNDVWMLRREGTGGPYTYSRALVADGGDVDEACATLEARGTFVRLDPDVTPTRFRFPIIGEDELRYLRAVPKENIIRKGRVKSIAAKGEGSARVTFGKGHEPWLLPRTGADRVFVHCTSPGPFNGQAKGDPFASQDELRLNLLCAPPVSICMSILAKLEGARRNGSLDLTFGREVLCAGSLLEEGEAASDNDVLRRLIRTFDIEGDTAMPHFVSLATLAAFFALVDEDPMVGYAWIKRNRLSFFSIPGFRSGLVDDLASLIARGKKLGLMESQVRMLRLLHEKLQPLKGK